MNTSQTYYFKTFYKATIIKTVCYWHKDRHIDQWNGTESPDVNSNIYGQCNSNKGAKTIQWGKNSLLYKQCWDTGYPNTKKLKWDSYFSSYIKINSEFPCGSAS